MKKILVGTLILSMVLGSTVVFADTPPEIYQSLTGKTVEELKQMREEGKTIWEAAEEDGVLEEFKDNIYEDAKEKLDAAVEDGRLTQEEADEKLAYLEEKLESGEFDRGHGPKKELTEEEKEDILEKAKEKLDNDVDEGKMTREEADERLADIEKRLEDGTLFQSHRPKKELTEEEKQERIEKAKERIAQLVEEGKMTQEEADEKIVDIEDGKFMMHGKGEGHDFAKKELTEEEKQERLEMAEEKLDTLVGEGKITQEKSGEILENLKTRMEDGFSGDRINHKPGQKRNELDCENI